MNKQSIFNIFHVKYFLFFRYKYDKKQNHLMLFIYKINIKFKICNLLKFLVKSKLLNSLD